MAARGKLDDALARLDGCGAEPDLVALCKRCLATEPADRPRDAGEVATAVAGRRAAAEARAKAAEVEAGQAVVRAAEELKRRRALLAAGGVVLTVLLAGIAGTTVGLVRADAARRDAETAQRETEAKRVEAELATADALAKRAEAEAARQAEAVQKRTAVAKEAEATAVVRFFEDNVFTAARPKGQAGGLKQDVTLREAITASLPALATGFADQPLVEARLRLTPGIAFHYLGDAKAAAVQQERSRAIYAERLGPDHPATL